MPVVDKMFSVLAVDDHKICLRAIEKSLCDHFDVSIAQSGESALQLLHKQSFDLVLLDINMPGMSGYEVIEKIKQINQQVPVVAFTAQVKDPEHWSEAGFSGVINKGVPPVSMHQTCLSYLS